MFVFQCLLCSDEDDSLIAALRDLLVLHNALSISAPPTTTTAEGTGCACVSSKTRKSADCEVCSLFSSLVGCGPGIEAALSPHALFGALLRSFGYDHSVLLDFLIGDETCFLEYLLLYLKLLRRDFAQLTQAATETASVAASVSVSESACACASAFDLRAVCACLLRLSQSIERSQAKGVFPYDAKPLLRSLAAVATLAKAAVNFADHEQRIVQLHHDVGTGQLL